MSEALNVTIIHYDPEYIHHPFPQDSILYPLSLSVILTVYVSFGVCI